MNPEQPTYKVIDVDKVLGRIKKRDWIPSKLTFPIVCICGSVRFSNEMLKQAARLTEEGYIVVMPHSFEHDKFHMGSEDNISKKSKLDIMHFQKVIMSDFIYVVNIDGYIGTSTAREIEVARSFGKPIEYLVRSWNYQCDTCTKRFDSEYELRILRCDSCRVKTMDLMKKEAIKAAKETRKKIQSLIVMY